MGVLLKAGDGGTRLNCPGESALPRPSELGVLAAARGELASHPTLTLQNRLLAMLSADVRNRLIPHLTLVPLSRGAVLYESEARISHVYFPNDAIICFSNSTQAGASTDTSMVGREGLVGISALLGGGSPTSRGVVQSAGTAYRLPVSILKEEFNRYGEFLHLALRYSQSVIALTAQTVVCNRHHSIDQQLCRWLLLFHDRLSTPEMAVTHEMIAHMLGVRREGVTAAAGKLQMEGIIAYGRGRITVKDRERLEMHSCECYAVVKKETDRLLGDLHA